MNQTTRFFLEFLYQYVSFYPCVLLCCFPFADKHKQPVRKIAVIFAFICIPVAAIPAALYAFFGIGSTAIFVALLFMAGSFFFYRKTLGEGLHKLLFTFFLVTHMVCIATETECSAVSLTGTLLLRGVRGGIPSFLMCTLLRLAAYFVIWRLMSRFITPRLRRIKTEDMKGLWVLSVIFTAVSVYRICTHVHDGTHDVVFPALTVFFTLLSFIVYNLILRLIDSAMTRAKLEEEVKRNNLLNKTKTEILQDMRHELKAPLTVIAAGIDFASQEAKAGDGSLAEASDALSTIRAETQRLGRMIDNMASLSALDGTGGNRKRIDFAAQLRKNAERFRYALGQQGNMLTIELPTGMPEVFAEADKFTLVISNLMTNAAEHTKNGQVTVAADFNDEYITVCISDTGEGVPPDILPKVFERGVSGRNSTGYGLNICKTVVEAHGGTIELESEPGKGCAVTFTVPVDGGQEAGHSL